MCNQNSLTFFSETSKDKFDSDKRKFAKSKANAEKRGRTINYSSLLGDYGALPDNYYEQLLTFFTESPRSFKDIGIGFLAALSRVLDLCMEYLEDDDISIDKAKLYQLLVLMFWEVMDDSAALGETIQDDVRKGLPGRSKSSDFGLSFDFLTALDKGLLQRIQEVLCHDGITTRKILDKVRDLFFASSSANRY